MLTTAEAAQGEVVALDVLIEPGAALADRARQLNQRLRRDYPRGFGFDATHVPHVSLLHRFVYRRNLDRLYGAVARIVARPQFVHLRLHATGLEIGPVRRERATVSINLQRSPQLLQLQRELVDAVASLAAPDGTAEAFVRVPALPQEEPDDIESETIDYVRNFVPQRTAEHFSPHLTVGLASASAVQQLKGEPFETFGAEARRFAIYQLGNLGTARSKLWPYPK